MFFLTLFIALRAVLALCAFYLMTRFRQMWLHGRDPKTLPKKTRRNIWLFSILPILPLAAGCVIEPYVVVVAALHLILFWILFDLIFAIVSKCTKKRISEWICGICAISCTVIYLTYCCFVALHVVRTDYDILTEKVIPELRIAMIADSHIGACFDGEGFAEHLQEIAQNQPDMLLISGDFVDDDTTRKDMVRCCQALGELDLPYGVFYVPGNHDAGYSEYRDFKYEDLVTELRNNHVYVLEDEVVEFDDVYIVGRKDRSMNRLPIEDLLAPLDPEKYIVVLDHQPNDYDAEEKAGCDLVVSGHTHGGQMLPINWVGEWIGANDATYGMIKRQNTVFIVTSGIADWAVPLRAQRFRNTAGSM